MARGIMNGWIDPKTYEPIVWKAWQGISEEIEEDGTVHNICYGTMCSENVEYYLQRPFYDNDTHGIFAVIVAAIEMSRLKNASSI